MPNYALGRSAPDPTKPKLRLRRSAIERPVPPGECDWLSQVPAWGMLANDAVGDCTAAGAAHIAMLVDRNAQGRDIEITDEQTLEFYSAISGYDPSDPNTDIGATLQDALDQWRKTGIAGNTIAAAALLDAQDLDLVRACIAIFGSVYCGMSMPESAMQQLDYGEPWTVQRRTRDLGGHCVPIGAYDAQSFTCVTWGQTQQMTVDFALRYVDEIWVPIDLDWLSSAGVSPAGLDIASLNSDFEALTGQPGPFPPGLPTPTPAPNPTPTPDPAPQPGGDPNADPDADLIAAFEIWRSARGL
jgi:hypothetical protein